jgi:hypothetical protein
VALAVPALLSASALDASRVSMRASPSIAFAPANLVVQTRVEAAAVNRALEVIADSGHFYRSSEIPLDGEHAPRTLMVEFRDLPAGRYDIRAVLKGQDGRELATIGTRVTVVETVTTAR